jgi:orotidine-5'-phosphate decarboxylase
MNFLERVLTAQKQQRSLLCIGLDTDPALIPSHLGNTAESVLDFNREIIAATHDLVCAYKMNLGFYDALGRNGWDVLHETMSRMPSTVLTIGDGKRADIGNSSERYVKALFKDLHFDAITVNPYMGYDSVEPFLKDEYKGVFVLSLTSNPGSADFQRLPSGDATVYRSVVLAAKKWNKKKNVGLVVGATHPDELREIRELAPTMPFLIPGIGKQGGDLEASVKHGCDKSGLSAIINSGRSILYASKERDFASAARNEALRLRDAINAIRGPFE